MNQRSCRFIQIDESVSLKHHGILGQKWGKRNGPPYPLGGGSYTQSERKAIIGKRRRGNSLYNKRHFDEVLSAKKTTLSTLSFNKDRTKNTDMFYATHKVTDKHQYNALFNRPLPMPVLDEHGNVIGTSQTLKFRIDNSLKSDIKVASEDSSAEIFRNLYKKDRDFYNFVTDKDRMQKYFIDDKYGFKGYREARDSLDKFRSGQTITSDDLQKIYRLFNYVIPYDGGGGFADPRGAKDVLNQRVKFFKACKEAGYGAILDTNDAIYGRYKATSPVIVFDMEQIIPKSIYQTTFADKEISSMILAVKKLLKL